MLKKHLFIDFAFLYRPMRCQSICHSNCCCLHVSNVQDTSKPKTLQSQPLASNFRTVKCSAVQSTLAYVLHVPETNICLLFASFMVHFRISQTICCLQLIPWHCERCSIRVIVARFALVFYHQTNPQSCLKTKFEFNSHSKLIPDNGFYVQRKH